jgi:hypothetical protein
MSIFKCGKHDVGYDTIEEFHQHLADEIHTTTGSAPCNLCGLNCQFSFTGKKGKKAPALCSTCKDIVLEGSN